MTTATASTTSKINSFTIGWIRKTSRCTCGTPFTAIFWRSLPKPGSEIFIFHDVTKTLARISKPSILCLFHENHSCQASTLRIFCTHDKHEIIAKHLTWLKVLFQSDVFVAVAVEAFLTIYFKSTSWKHCTVELIWQFILLLSCINSAQMSVSLKSLAYQVRFGSKLLFRNFQDVSKWGRLCCGQFDFLVKFCGFQYLQSKAKICSRSNNSSLLVPCEHGKSTFCEFGDS